VDFAKAKKVDCAIASIARGRAVRVVCQALGVSRNHVMAKKDRATDWADLRRSPPKSDDAQVKQAIADDLQKRATFGYRRVWARLRLDDHMGINLKRV
jgi:putative transposase